MITALLVSVNYSDYLEVALPYNVLQFDQIIILTIESDNGCQEVCSKHSNVKCLAFPDNLIKKNGLNFNRGALFNEGFKYLNETGYSDWLVMTDADIIFPENFNKLMLSKKKDPTILPPEVESVIKHMPVDRRRWKKIVSKISRKESTISLCKLEELLPLK